MKTLLMRVALEEISKILIVGVIFVIVSVVCVGEGVQSRFDPECYALSGWFSNFLWIGRWAFLFTMPFFVGAIVSSLVVFGL